ncbi:hypothetical protein GCK32_015912 [Trichostrongylus colubriformis]|uniref:Large ribosomal subunit protein uL4 C-terminal domain-containing protein n=1 Tax=Trichostrongylus colubriformis TaxID=6319 RepID=A0AAN8FTI9_TRICO
MRNKLHKRKLGPVLIYGQDADCARAFRNIPGVDILNVERLNLLKLAPGGHLGRLIIWTESAFKKLDAIYGTLKANSSEQKNGWSIPLNKLTNADLSRLIRSEEIVRAVRPVKKNVKSVKDSDILLKNSSIPPPKPRSLAESEAAVDLYELTCRRSPCNCSITADRREDVAELFRMDDDASQPSTSCGYCPKDCNRSKFDRLVKKVGRKLLPRPNDNIFVPSSISSC